MADNSSNMSMTSRNWVLPPKPKPGRKPLQSTSEREARNRATQRAFRERRKALITELRDELHEKEIEFTKKEDKMTRRIHELEQQLAISQKQCAQLATALGRTFLDGPAACAQTVQEETIQMQRDLPRELEQIGFELGPQPDEKINQIAQPSSPCHIETEPRHIPPASADEVETEVDNLDENGDALSSVHPELFDDPLLDNLSLSPVSSTYGYLHHGLDDTINNSPLELDDTELRQFSLSRSSFG